jgi:CHASE2 domain-containing sensor protein
VSPEEILERELERFEGRAKTGSGWFWKKFRRSRAAFVVLAISIAFLQFRGLPEEFSNVTLDAAAILQTPVQPKHVRLVKIDEHEYQTTYKGQSPLDPSELSQLVTAIGRGGPAVIVVDIDTSHPIFKEMKAPREVPIIWTTSAEEVGTSGFEPEKPLGGAPLAPKWRRALDLIPRDKQGIIRSYARQFPLRPGGYGPSLEYAASRAYKGLPESEVDKSDNERLLDFRYKFFPIPAQEIREKSVQPGWSNGVIRGAIVVLGGTYKAARDRYPTPNRLMDGAEIVAQGIEAEVENTGIPRANPWLAGMLQMLAGLGLVVLYRVFSLRIALLSSLLLIPALSMAASLLLFHRLALWAALVPVLLAILVTELYAKASLYLGLCSRFRELRKNGDAEGQTGSKERAAEIGGA